MVRNTEAAAGSLSSRVENTPGQTPSQEPYIQCRDMFKIYKRAELEVVALRGLDLDVAAGELIAIIGASGSGKSTLMNILAGLDRPSAGQIQVGSRDLLNITDRDLVMFRRLEVGFVWQATGRNLVPYLTVLDNVELPMAMAGVPASQRRGRSKELLSSLGLEDKAGRLPHQLSGGEQQRVSIGVGLANRPPLLLADEPTGELDTENAQQVFGLLRDLNQTYQVTVVVVTHYAGAAEFVDRVVHIRDGRISTETYSSPTFQRPGATTQEEFLVVDRAGRLQLPPEYAEKFQKGGLAKFQLDGENVTITPAAARRRPGGGDQDGGGDNV